MSSSICVLNMGTDTWQRLYLNRSLTNSVEIWVILGFGFKGKKAYLDSMRSASSGHSCRHGFFLDVLGHLLSTSGNFLMVVRSTTETFVLTDYQSTQAIFVLEAPQSAVLICPLAATSDLDDVGFLAGGVAIGMSTAFADITSLPPASLIRLSGSSLEVSSNIAMPRKYDRFDSEYLHDLLQTAFEPLKNLQEKKIYLMLSGGLDSHLVFYFLIKLGIKFEAIIYGEDYSLDVKYAKKLCHHFSVRVKRIKRAKKIFYKFEFRRWLLDFIKLSGLLQSYPNLQEADVMFMLKDIVDSGSIIINGSTGDFLSGSHIKPEFVGWNEAEIVEAIIKKFYSFRNLDYQDSCALRSRISKEISQIASRLKVNLPSTKVYERFELENRQVKYIIPMRYLYNHANFKSFLPLWDPSVVSYMLSLDVSEKRGFGAEYARYVDALFCMEGYKIGQIRRAYIPFIPMCLRALTKIMFVFLPSSLWVRFDKRFFFYFYDPAGTSACFRYRDFVFGSYKGDVGVQLNYIDKMRGA